MAFTFLHIMQLFQSMEKKKEETEYLKFYGISNLCLHFRNSSYIDVTLWRQETQSLWTSHLSWRKTNLLSAPSLNKHWRKKKPKQITTQQLLSPAQNSHDTLIQGRTMIRRYRWNSIQSTKSKMFPVSHAPGSHEILLHCHSKKFLQ